MMNEKGVNRPIREGLDMDVRAHLSDDELDEGPSASGSKLRDDEATSEEEPELPGVTRPKKGAGWWGRGQPIQG